MIYNYEQSIGHRGGEPGHQHTSLYLQQSEHS